jgi:two-component system, chemotaxis family, sensor kinase Cph1
LHSKEEFEGNGIGLSNCKKIVQSHQGKIWIESNDQQGTTFYFTIPRLTI